MALFRYSIIFSPSAFGQCDEGNTALVSVEINETSQDNIEVFRLADNPCAFLNTVGLEVGPAGSSVNVTINAQTDTGAIGNRNFRFFMCSGGRQYTGPVESPDSDPNGSITLSASYAVGPKVKDGDCVAFLKSKMGGQAEVMLVAATPKPKSRLKNVPSGLSEKEQTKRTIKRLLNP